MPDPSHVCDLYHSSWQCWILNPLSEARDLPLNLMVPSQIRFRCIATGTPARLFLKSECESVCVCVTHVTVNGNGEEGLASNEGKC